MPVIVNYTKRTFWTPANANGRAVTVDGDINNRAFKINLYWSGMLLATSGNPNEQQLNDQVGGFLANLKPTNIEESIMHLEYDGETFQKIVDPEWVQGLPVV